MSAYFGMFIHMKNYEWSSRGLFGMIEVTNCHFDRECLLFIRDFAGTSQMSCAAASEKQFTYYAKTKAQISCAVTAQLISSLVFATRIVQSFFFLNPTF